jgi:hypothetical protein
MTTNQLTSDYFRGRNHGWVDVRAGLDKVEKTKIFALEELVQDADTKIANLGFRSRGK